MTNMLKSVRRWTAVPMVVVLVLLLMPYSEGLAQKKKTTTKSEAPAAEQQVTTSSKTPPGATVKDFLGKFKGVRTNLGVLMRLEADHFVVDDDGTVSAYPYAAIRSIKLLKVEEGEENPELLDISLL